MMVWTNKHRKNLSESLKKSWAIKKTNIGKKVLEVSEVIVMPLIIKNGNEWKVKLVLETKD